jgi:copper chaperone CopZ
MDFRVEMTCGGCVNAVRNSLRKTLGEQMADLQIDLAARKVSVELVVRSDLNEEQVLELLSKCGKPCKLWTE